MMAVLMHGSNELSALAMTCVMIHDDDDDDKIPRVGQQLLNT